MDKLDCRILRELQNNFPLDNRPYEVIADRLQISPERLWNSVKRMLDEGIIRRIGASFDSNKLGFSSTLAAVSAKPEFVDQAAKVIGQFPEVTHSYLRRNTFNIWFTIVAPASSCRKTGAGDNDRIENILEQIQRTLSTAGCLTALGNSQVLNLHVKRLFKLDTRCGIK